MPPTATEAVDGVTVTWATAPGLVHGFVPPNALLRGAGSPAAKSAELTFVSCAPFSFRKIAFVFDGAGAAALPSKRLEPPKPTRSTKRASAAPVHGVAVAPQFSAPVPVTRTTLPVVALRLAPPLASVAGRSAPGGFAGGLFAARPTRKYFPGWIVPVIGTTSCDELPKLPVALPYWIDMPSSVTGTLLVLYSST